MIVELTKAQMKRAVDIYMEEMTIEELEKFVMKVVKEAVNWADMDWAPIKKIVDKQVYKQEDREDVFL